MKVTYFSHAGHETGYGRAARDWQEALRLAGVEVEPRPLLEARYTEEPDEHVAVYHGTPAQLAEVAETGPGQVRIAVTTWETSYLPVIYAYALSLFDKVVVPSRFCREVIEKSAMAADVYVRLAVVPHCFDPLYWAEHSDRPAGDVYTFYTIGSWGERKNLLGLLRAYLHAFDKGDRVRLVVISSGCDFDAVRALIGRSALPPELLPGLVVPDQVFSPQDIMKLHRDSDCFVTATRGEGWGLGMFEAAIMRRPVIAPGYGGQVDFLRSVDDADWREVPYQMTPVFAGEGEVAVSGAQVSGKLTLPRGADARQLWAEPDLSALANRMRAVWEDSERDYGYLSASREELEDRFSAPVVGQVFRQALEG